MRITGAGLRESHVHDVTITRESPNYPGRGASGDRHACRPTLLWPMLAHIGWVFLLYAWLTDARDAAVRRGEVENSGFVLGREEPLDVARITRNLANQFELPVIFYALVVLLIALGKVTAFDVIAPGCSSRAASSTRWCRR